MSAISHAAGLRLTPKNRFHPTHTPTHTPVKQAREDSGLQLILKNVIGTTTRSPNAFDASPAHHTFVCCAGPAAILSQVDENLNITQRLFRARPNASPVNATPSFYNPSTPPITPARSRQGSPLKEGGYGLSSTASLEYAADSQGLVKAGNRSRECTCVSLSHCGKFLAVGETGYSPRVIVFSAVLDAPSDVPLSVLSDHSFGVSSVAFSRDSRWLCTLGNSYDGFVLIYSINIKSGLARLHSSNKCSNVICVIWMGSCVISFGIRHVKVWRLERATPSSPSKTRLDLENNLAGPLGSPTPRTFCGRNCLLGELINATFTAAVAISDSKAILCTAQGEICLLDDTDRTQRLEKVARVDFRVHCITFDGNEDLVWVAGEGGVTSAITLDDLTKANKSSPLNATSSSLQSNHASNVEKGSSTLALATIRKRIISIDANHVIEIRTAEEINKAWTLSTRSKRLPAHESAVLGVRSLIPKSEQDAPDFLTFSAKGTVLFWLLNGTCTGSLVIPLERLGCLENGDTNEVKTVVPFDGDSYLVSGDKSGVLRLVDRSNNKHSAIKAHNGDINGIGITKTENVTIVATCGRDRTLQLFAKDGLELRLFQTLDDHAAAIGDLTFLDGPATLLSISSDRTIIIRKMAWSEDGSLAYIPVRVVNLKASPISFAVLVNEPNAVVVSTMDRQIHRYDMSTGRPLHSFKASDPASGDSVIMSSLEVHKLDHGSDQQVLLGVSSTDKSIRVHDCESGSLLAKEHGQLAVSAIKLIQEPTNNGSLCSHIISCGLDGTIMTWELSSQGKRTSGSNGFPNGANDAESPTKLNGTPTQPLRRILSKAEISDFQRSLESDGDTISPISRAPSPSRIRRKTSRFSLAATPKLTPPSLSSGLNSPMSPSRGNSDRRCSLDHSPPGSTPQNKRNSKSKRPTLDDRRRSKSITNLNNLNDSAEQLCQALQNFRKRIASAASAKLNPSTAQELEAELKLTIGALSEKRRNNYVGSATMAGDLLDVYLAKMIDERLALKAESEQMEQKTKEAAEVSEADAISGAQKTASELE